MITSRSTSDASNGIITFSFLWLSNIPVCVRVRACVCVCVYTHYIFIIHLFVDEHVGCIHVLAIVNSAIMNTGVQVSFQSIFFSPQIYAQEWDCWII